MGKIPTYTKKAIDKYRKKHYFMQIRLPLDYKERLAETGITSAWVSDMVKKEVEKRETLQTASEKKS